MTKMVDMGTKNEYHGDIARSNDEPRITYSGFSVKGDKIPQELRDAKVGDSLRCEIEIKKTGDTIDTYSKGQPPRVEVEIHKLGYIGKGGKMNKDEYLKSSKEERENYDKEDLGVEEDK